MLIDQIKSDQIKARLARDAVRAGLLTSLIGEIESKVRGNEKIKTPEDVEAVALSQIKKFIDGANEMIEKASGRPEIVEQSKAEIAILDGYRPKQMTEDQLRKAIAGFKAHNAGANIGQYMGWLKKEHGGSYDGAMAQRIVKEMLA
jgi:uncharacterized protein YqeY